MAKNRYVNTHFWSDPYISDLDPIEKLLFLYFLTNPFTNIAGIYEITLKQIALDTGIDRDMILKIIERFSRDKKIFYFDGWVFILNHSKHQEQGSEKVKVGILRIFQEIPEKIKKCISDAVKGMDSLPYLIDTKFNLNLIKIDTKREFSDGRILPSAKDQDQKPEIILNGNIDLNFNKFWKFYKRREGDEMEVRKKFIEVIKTQKDFDNLIVATRNYNDLTGDRKLQYVKTPIKFLEKYKDFISV